MFNDEILWVEIYRPKKVNDCVLPKKLSDIFSSIVKSGKIPNLLLYGPPGTGKTSVAKALCEELNVSYLYINAAIGGDVSGIEALRYDIKKYASSVAFNGGRKAVILDEADRLSPKVQDALKVFIEQYSNNCSFIFISNHSNQIIDAIHSRCSYLEFIIPDNEMVDVVQRYVKNIFTILDTEKITYNKKAVTKFVFDNVPDFRKSIHELQIYAQSHDNNIDEGVLVEKRDYSELISAFKNKNFQSIRDWVTKTSNNDFVKMYSQLYDELKNAMNKKSLPELVLIIADYQYKHSFSADPEICFLACLITIMMQCEFI